MTLQETIASFFGSAQGGDAGPSRTFVKPRWKKNTAGVYIEQDWSVDDVDWLYVGKTNQTVLNIAQTYGQFVFEQTGTEPDAEYISSQKMMVNTGLGEVGKLRAQAALPALEFLVDTAGEIVGGGVRERIGLSTMDKSQQVWIRIQRQRLGTFSNAPADNLYMMGGVKSESIDVQFDASTQRFLEINYTAQWLSYSATSYRPTYLDYLYAEQGTGSDPKILAFFAPPPEEA